MWTNNVNTNTVLAGYINQKLALKLKLGDDFKPLFDEFEKFDPTMQMLIILIAIISIILGISYVVGAFDEEQSETKNDIVSDSEKSPYFK